MKRLTQYTGYVYTCVCVCMIYYIMLVSECIHLLLNMKYPIISDVGRLIPETIIFRTYRIIFSITVQTHTHITL